ncbi:unnamed protein product [Adineta steineri]|uniref:Uncharacterized protein n=1 Tax=Adineta steineri TaxID=433720 RepID=A0A818MHB8_9BILA|nr:unnamed protein product [Adineta steineri]
MQSDVLNDQQQQQQQLSNDTDCSSSLSTTLIYSGLKLHPKPFVPTISMSSMTNPVSIVKKLSIPDTHPDNSTKPLGSTIRHSSTSTTPSSIRLVTPTTGKSSPPTTALQLQFLDKSSTTTANGGYTTSKTYILNPQQTSSSGTSSLVTLIPPGTTSPKIQTLISSTNDLSNNNNNDQKNSKQSSFISKNRLTFVQPLVTNASSTSSSSNSVTSKLVIQQNSTSNIWSQQPTTKILSAKMLSRPLHIISSNEHSNLSSPTSNDNPIFTTKNLVQMSILPSSSTTDSINSVQLTNFYSTPSSVRISTTQQRPMDHNNNHSLTTPTIREIQTDEKLNDSTIIKNIHSNKNSIKNRTRLPLQPSTQQISSILPTSKKHKLPDDDEVSLSEPPTKKVHYEQFDSSSNGKKIRKTRHKSLSKTSIENTTPNSLPSSSSPLTSSIGVDTTGIIVSKKRSSAEIAAAAILSSNHMRKKRVQRKNSDETVSNNNNNNNNIKQETISVNDLSTEIINDELLKRLSQDFVYVDKRTGIRWIGTKARSQPMNTLLSRFSWKPKISHYEKYSDMIRTNPKRTVPVKSPDTIRTKLTQPWASWRIDRLTTYLTDLTQCEQTTQNNLSDISQLLNQLDINDHSVRNTIEDLIGGNIQRHRYFCEQLTQISTLLVNLLDHGNTLREICSTSKLTPSSISITNSTSTRRIKER